MLNSGNIQSLFSSSQDSPSTTQFYNHDQDPNNNYSKDQELPPFFLLSSNLPSVIDEHQLPIGNNNSTNYQLEKPCDVIKSTKRRIIGASSRRKAGKKSRHSKICTAQGVRDRRMRLSLPIARKFFDLQDLLGFDKASKTIEWLFSNSQKEIKELQMKNLPQGNDSYCNIEEASEAKFMSDFEVKSANDVEENPNNGNDIKESRKTSVYNYRHAKQRRERARARARERTRERREIKGIKQWYDPNPSKDNLEHLGHFYPFEDHSSSHNQYGGVSHEKDYSNSTSIGLLQNFEGCNNNSVISTMGLVTNDPDVSTCGLPTRKFPFLLQ